MEKRLPVALYLFIFLCISLLLRAAGIADIPSLELLGYMMMIFGISYFFAAFGKERKAVLFISTIIFFIGVILFLMNNFEFMNPVELVFPAILLIAGISFIVLYIDGGVGFPVLFLSIVFIVFGIVFTALSGELSIGSFFIALFNVAVKYWVALIILAVLVLLILWNEKRQNKEPDPPDSV